MNLVTPDPGSFRDPSGRIYYVGDRVFRTITEHAAAEFEFVRDSGIIDRLVSEGRLIKSDVVSADVLGGRSLSMCTITYTNEKVNFAVCNFTLNFIMPKWVEIDNEYYYNSF